MATPEVRVPARREEATKEIAPTQTPDTAEVPVVGGPDEPTVGSLAPKRPWYRRRWLILTAVAVLAAAGLGIGLWLGLGGSSVPAISVTTEVATVSTGTMQQTVAATGTIEPGQQSNLNFGVSGQVTAVNVSAGQQVTAGQALATVDPTALQAQYDSAEASLSAAQATLSNDESNNASDSQIASDEASVTSAQSQLTTAQNNLNDATLTSPINGTVASVDLAIGQLVSGSGSGSSGSGTGSSGTGSSDTGSSGTGSSGSGIGSSGSGSSGSGTGSSDSGSSGSGSSGSSSSSTQIVVINTSSFVVDASVDDTEVGQIKNGDQAVITPSSSTTNVYGTVASVGVIASTTSGVASFPVTINVTGTPSGLYDGSSANVSIVTQQLNDVVEVPTTAISYSGGQATVTLVENGQHVSRPVTTGVTDNGDTQVTSGLKAGDKVLERVVKFTAPSGAAGAGSFLGRGGLGGGGAGGGGRFFSPGGATGAGGGGAGGFPGGGSGG